MRQSCFESSCLILENPLAPDYDNGRVVKRLAPLRLPFGMANTVARKNVFLLPLKSMAHYVALPGNGLDWMRAEHKRFLEGK